MDYLTARDNLIKLLCCSVETLDAEQLKKLVKKRYKLWHPDKNHEDPERYRDNFMCLKESYDVFLKGPQEDSGTFTAGTSAEDIFCHEEWDPSWESNSDSSDYNSTPFDDEFFNASPKKNFAVPEELRLFFRSKTNRRAGKLFMLFTFRDDLHRKCMEKLSKDDLFKSFVCFAARTNKDIFAALIITHTDHRLIDIKKRCKHYSLKVTELFYAVHQFKLIDKLNEMYNDAIFSWGSPIERKVKEESAFNHKQLVDFAISHDMTDVYTLMYEYAHLSDPCDRDSIDITKDHEDDHTAEILNAKKFVTLVDRSRVCKNAVECVIAKLYRQLSQMSNTQWLEMRSREVGERLLMIDDCNIFGEAFYYWKYCVTKELFFDIMSFIIGIFTDSKCRTINNGKCRYMCLIGPYNCGKTTFAAAICKFFEGVNININVSRDRLPFYIGAAISKRFVLFDDVKGYHSKVKNLPTGTGIGNLDDLREHLDGKIEVQLEKKNKNPVNQIFPQGIVTMNLYKIPSSLKIRLRVINFPPSALYKRHRFNVTMDTIFIAMAIDNLIPCDKEVIAHIIKKKDIWLTQHRKKCSCINQVSDGCCTSYFRCFCS